MLGWDLGLEPEAAERQFVAEVEMWLEQALDSISGRKLPAVSCGDGVRAL